MLVNDIPQNSHYTLSSFELCTFICLYNYDFYLNPLPQISQTNGLISECIAI